MADGLQGIRMQISIKVDDIWYRKDSTLQYQVFLVNDEYIGVKLLTPGRSYKTKALVAKDEFYERYTPQLAG